MADKEIKPGVEESGEIPSGTAGKKNKKEIGMGMTEPASEAVPAGKVMVDQSVLEQMNERLMAAEAKLAGAAPVAPKRVAANDTRVLFVENKYPVVAFGKVFDKELPHRPGKPAMYIEITLLLDAESGQTEVREVDYINLLNDSPRFLADIKKQTMSSKTIPQGVKAMHWTTVNPDPANVSGNNANFQPRQIVLEHTVPEYRALIEFREGPWNGTEIEVSTDCLNP